jgi:hypothetical protein
LLLLLLTILESEYEKKTSLQAYLEEQEKVIAEW